MGSDKVYLADAIKNLRLQLQEAIEEGHDEKLHFDIKDLELELKCGVTREGGGKTGVKFWLIEAGAEGKMGKESSQTIKLKLSPEMNDGPVKLSDKDRL